MDGELPHPKPAADIFHLQLPIVRSLPLVLASPHSGTEYSPEFLASSRLDPVALRRSEDTFVDELFGAAPRLGVPLLSARFPRAYIDVNREAYELDPSMFVDALPKFVNAASPRVRMGLGTIARIVASGEEIYAKKLRFVEAQRRIRRLYQPYHQALRGLILETAALFGGCLLVDCHSMPSGAGSPGDTRGADVVLGDCHGVSCAPQFIEAARYFLTKRGFAVAINVPYAGGFTTRHYGCPSVQRHALQVEVNRALYMDERDYERKPYFRQLVQDLAELVDRLGRVAQESLARQPNARCTSVATD